MRTAVAELEQCSVSVIVPAYNAEAFIAASLQELIAYLAAWPGAPELIVVNDGSTDRTAERLAHAVRDAPIEVRLVDNARNQGKGAAVCRGMQLARGHSRLFLDADLPYPPSEIARICAALADGADVAIACRVDQASRYLVRPASFRSQYARHLAGRMFNWLVRLVLLPGIRDTQAGLKGFTATAAAQLFTDLPPGFGFDLALLHRAQQLGLRIDQVPVFYRHVDQPTTVRAVDTLQVLRDLVRIRLRSSSAPAPSPRPRDTSAPGAARLPHRPE